MSSRYDRALVLTLKLSVSPMFTLIWVANPWIPEVPEPEMSHSLAGLPGLLFSQATAFVTGGAHGSTAASERPASGGAANGSAAATTMAAKTDSRVFAAADMDTPYRPPARAGSSIPHTSRWQTGE